MSANKLRVFHEEILEEEGMSVSDLSTELQSRIKGFNLLRKKLEKNPDDERLYFQLQKSSVKIGDLVQNYIENDYDDDDNDDDDNDDDSKNKKSDDKKSDDKKSDDKKSDDKSDDKKSDDKSDDKKSDDKKSTPKTSSGKFGNSMMEKKILSIMEARGEKRIRISDLEAIIGKEPNYPEQEVNNIKLRKVFLSNDYRLV
jgi:cobalamin biosynthesis protein CobT